MATLDSRIINLVGLKFNRLSVIEFSHLKSGRSYWLCQCDCGTEKIMRADGIKTSVSCGCYQIERVTKHNLSRSPEYKVLKSLIQRCVNKNCPAYPDYGGRGIKVCDRWLYSFEAFFEDMGKRPKGHSIERIDNTGNYEPSNCKWATQQEQVNNRRSNTLLTCNGKTQTIAQWKREMGLKRNNIEERLKHGWSIDQAINTPRNTRRSA